MQVLGKNYSIKKKFVILLFMTLFIIFLYFDDIKIINNNENSIKNFEANRDDYKFFPSDQWVFNFNVSQYSSILSGGLNESLYVESMVFFDQMKSFQKYKDDLRCYVRINDKTGLFGIEEILSIPLMHISSYPKSLWRVKCKIDNDFHANLINNIGVAIIDKTYFDYYSVKFNKNQILMLQQPTYFNTTIPKKKAVANCVHMVTRIDDERFDRIKNWIQLQKQFGFDKIKFYFYDVAENQRKKFQQIKENLIEIVNYSTSFDQICYRQIKLLEKDPQSELVKFLYDSCKRAHDLHFKMSDSMIYNSHERMNTNDCLLKFKYQYEYVTNYDFDEIIFPRLLNTNSYDNLVKSNETNCSQVNLMNETQIGKYSIYDFASRLFEKYGNKVGNLHFDHVIFFKEHSNFTEDILNLNADSKNTIFKYKFSNSYVDYKLEEKHKNLVDSFKRVIQLANCLNQTHMINSKFNFKWNNLYASKMDMRDGKSIFRTDFVQSVNQHWANNFSPGTHRHNVPISDGFVSHFRDNINGFIYKQSYPFDFLQIDLEYYLFLLSFSKLNIDGVNEIY